MSDLRPYVPLERHDGKEVEHGMFLRPSAFIDPARTEVAVNALKHHATKEKARVRVVNYLRFLEVIEPLVRSEVVVLVEHDVSSPVTQQGLLRDKKAVASAAEFSDLPDEGQERLQKWGELARRSYVSRADKQLARGLEADGKFGGLDLYMPYRYYEDVLRGIVEEGAREKRWPRTVELRVLNDVCSTSPSPGSRP